MVDYEDCYLLNSGSETQMKSTLISVKVQEEDEEEKHFFPFNFGEVNSCSHHFGDDNFSILLLIKFLQEQLIKWEPMVAHPD